MKRAIPGMIVAALLLGGCQTTQETSSQLRNRWVGQPADAFFVANGPPANTYQREDGGRIHTWRGGEHTSQSPATVTAVTPAPAANNGWWSNSQAPDWWRTQAAPQRQPAAVAVVQPGRRFDYVCEAQIATNAAGTIESIRISRDTDGRGLSFSRCAEVLGQ